MYTCKWLMGVSDELAASMFKARVVQKESNVKSPSHIPQKLHLHQNSCETLKSLTQICGSFNCRILMCGLRSTDGLYTKRAVKPSNLSHKYVVVTIQSYLNVWLTFHRWFVHQKSRIVRTSLENAFRNFVLFFPCIMND